MLKSTPVHYPLLTPLFKSTSVYYSLLFLLFSSTPIHYPVISLLLKFTSVCYPLTQYVLLSYLFSDLPTLFCTFPPSIQPSLSIFPLIHSFSLTLSQANSVIDSPLNSPLLQFSHLFPHKLTFTFPSLSFH